VFQSANVLIAESATLTAEKLLAAASAPIGLFWFSWFPALPVVAGLSTGIGCLG